MGTKIRDRVPYPTRQDRIAAGYSSRSALAQVWRRASLARALKRDGLSKREYQRMTWLLSQSKASR